MIDLTNPEHAYFFGFSQADGHLSKDSRNRGRFSIELSMLDVAILQSFQQIFPVSSHLSFRTRDTNFKSQSQTAILRIHDWGFRDSLVQVGLPYGRKSASVAAPLIPCSWVDYWRGWIDGDGSLGISARNIPFVSFSTKSPGIAESFRCFLSCHLGVSISCNPNTRDGMYSFMLSREKAQTLASLLYPTGCLALRRKVLQAQRVIAWVRPPDCLRRDAPRQTWTPDHDQFILTRPLLEAIQVLGRTEKSIRVRLWRLRNTPKI